MIEHALSCDEHDFTRCPNFRRLVDNLADGRPTPADRAWLDHRHGEPRRGPRADGT